jgi:hypothetical protein
MLYCSKCTQLKLGRTSCTQSRQLVERGTCKEMYQYSSEAVKFSRTHGPLLCCSVYPWYERKLQTGGLILGVWLLLWEQVSYCRDPEHRVYAVSVEV